MTTPTPTTHALLRGKNALLTLLVGFFAAFGVLSLAHLGPAQAQSPGVNLAALVAQVKAQGAQIVKLQGTVTDQGDTIKSQGDTIKSQGDDITSQKAKIFTLFGQVSGLQATTAPIKTTGSATQGYLVTFTKANVQIVNGLDGTKTTNGLGNLIIGYNALGNDLSAGDVRTGSHNLILGDQNSYSSSGGLVAGADNAITDVYATVSGGESNTASGEAASVSGGHSNKASGGGSSVSGGAENTASYHYDSVSGGYFNKASGGASSVSGGENNKASGGASSVSGGESNRAIGESASVSGGNFNTASGQSATTSGGKNRSQSHDYGWSGGHYATDGP